MLVSCRLSLKVTSIVDEIPEAAATQLENGGQFGMAKGSIDMIELRKRKREEEVEQKKDAVKRKFVWVR